MTTHPAPPAATSSWRALLATLGEAIPADPGPPGRLAGRRRHGQPQLLPWLAGRCPPPRPRPWPPRAIPARGRLRARLAALARAAPPPPPAHHRDRPGHDRLRRHLRPDRRLLLDRHRSGRPGDPRTPADRPRRGADLAAGAPTATHRPPPSRPPWPPSPSPPISTPNQLAPTTTATTPMLTRAQPSPTNYAPHQPAQPPNRQRHTTTTPGSPNPPNPTN